MSVQDLYPKAYLATLDDPPPREAYSLAAQAIASALVGRPTWPDTDPATLDNKGYRLIALIYRCVNLISHAAGVAPVKVYDEARDDAELPGHKLRRLMRQPNPQMGEAIFWANVALRTAIAGFCVVEKERNRLGEPIGLWPLNSSWLKAIPRTNSPHDWEYRIPGIRDPIPLKAEDIVPFRWTDTPNGSPYGLGPVAPGMRSAALITKLIDFLGVLMDRGGVPMWGLIPDTMPGQTLRQDQVDELLRRFLERHGGIEKAAIPVILSGIKDMKRLGFDLDELAYTDLRDVSELEIVQAFGVPPTKAMLRVALEHSDSRANAEVDDATFYRDTMLPLWARFDDALTTSLLPDFEDPGSTIALKFDTSDIEALQENRNEKAIWVVPSFAGSLLTNHMALRELGIPIPKDLPEYFVRSIALEAIPVAYPLTGAAVLPAGDTTDNQLQRLGSVRIREITAGSGPTRRFAQATQNRALIAKVAKARAPSLAAFFTAQGKRIVASLKQPVSSGLATRDGRPLVTFVAADLVGVKWADEEQLLAKVLRPLHQLAGETAFGAAEEQIGVEISYDLANPRIMDVLDRLIERPDGPTGMTIETRTTVDRIITESLNEGATLDDIALRLTDQFTDMSAGRAMTIARSESQVSYGYASTLAYRETGVVDRVQLFDNPAHTEGYGAADGLSCAERDGLIVSLDDAEHHINSEHPNGSLSTSPVLTGED